MSDEAEPEPEIDPEPRDRSVMDYEARLRLEWDQDMRRAYTESVNEDERVRRSIVNRTFWEDERKWPSK